MEKLTILCVAIREMGHMNAVIGVAIALKNRGHRVVFAAEKSWRGKLLKFGLEEELYEERDKVEDFAGKQWGDQFSKFESMISKSAPEEKLKNLTKMFMKIIQTADYCNPQIQKIISNVKPDIIIEDFGIPLPALFSANVPIIKLFCVGPLFAFNDARLPPFGCGLPLNDKRDWHRCRQVIDEMMSTSLKQANDWFMKLCPQHPSLASGRAYLSTNLNIYLYPKPLVDDYLKLCPLNDTWIGVDHCLRKPFGDFIIPEKLQSRPGKLIYFSLGSIGTSFAGLMKRLIAIFANSKHRFIVSLGHKSNEFELADNMCGEKVLPQLAVISQVDLVVTHGGNNSFTETVYFGKPMIVLPLFGDQHDNAQRAVEANIGLRFDPFTVREEELNSAIDELLLDIKVVENVRRISKQIQESNSMDRVVEKIELVSKNPKFPTIY